MALEPRYSCGFDLVRSGIGTLTLVDGDFVELHNLQRQQLFTEQDADDHRAKVKAAAERLRQINSSVLIHEAFAELSAANIDEYVQNVDVIVDATDNFATRMLINDAARKNGVPWVYGGVSGSYGVSMPFYPDQSPCFRCLSPYIGEDEDCDTNGVLATGIQIVAAHQATHVLRILVGDVQTPKLYTFDVWKAESSYVAVSKLAMASCETCGPAPSYPALRERPREKHIQWMCARTGVQVRPAQSLQLDFPDNLNADEWHYKRFPDLSTFRKDGRQVILFKDGRAMIRGVQDTEEAEAIYDELMGLAGESS
ncbi:ThiF family adenylyltransferase [Geomicrobium sp. JCM 19039]|uniref:ThiF family adenylyltransferase n=1 Tax=Geomicrobium sp. JCM 19039 TaxID=1460636 RepID=UPI0006936B0E|nr:ThiF family adenylyltransferase [Geomicrobium sp. JCM 19039]